MRATVDEILGLLEENRQLKRCLKRFISAIAAACDDTKSSHIDSDLVRESMRLCGIDERIVDFKE